MALSVSQKPLVSCRDSWQTVQKGMPALGAALLRQSGKECSKSDSTFLPGHLPGSVRVGAARSLMRGYVHLVSSWFCAHTSSLSKVGRRGSFSCQL